MSKGMFLTLRLIKGYRLFMDTEILSIAMRIWEGYLVILECGKYFGQLPTPYTCTNINLKSMRG